MANIYINQGTQTQIANDTVGGSIYYQTVKLDIGDTGLTSLFTGTIPQISKLSTGTITSVQGGTIQTNMLSGTLNSLPNLPGGSIVVTTGTIASITNGNIVVTNATIGAGTVNTSTVNVSTLNAGTVNVATILVGHFKDLIR